ncbi:hypothetical protein Rhopal_000441-T1 [Rhodotorula paludigena]|uniref:Uncharacterized protein n=1 Tax=Rhodotorula paludigena TaxID=86838 RepID=A0AAV5GDT2_9BASI|nr:hypothetical protein Rhopal_000441-T1 [Rhodotorula paludigena]
MPPIGKLPRVKHSTLPVQLCIDDWARETEAPSFSNDYTVTDDVNMHDADIFGGPDDFGGLDGSGSGLEDGGTGSASTLPDELYLHDLPVRAVYPESARGDPLATPQKGVPTWSRPSYHPFATFSEWAIARFANSANLSRPQVDQLLDTLRDPLFNTNDLQGKRAEGLEAVLKGETEKNGVPWVTHPITIERDGEIPEITVDLYYKPIDLVVRSLLARPEIAELMRWVPLRLYHENQRVYADFATGEIFWDLHHEHESEGYALVLQLYSDASKITTFNNTKVWPVHVWLLNLPAGIRHSDEWIGSSLVGYLPVIDHLVGRDVRNSDPMRRGKHRIYQRAMELILKPVAQSSLTGTVFRCGDGAILAMWEVLRRQKRFAEARAILANHGMHPFKMFIGQDALGNWGKRVFPLLVSLMTSSSKRTLDLRTAKYPPFPGLRHFADVSGSPWVDGNAYRQLLKIFLYVAHDLLGKDESVFLILVRHFAQLDALESLHVHTDLSLELIERAVGRIELLMKLTGRKLEYPKLHSLGHIVKRIKDQAPSSLTTTIYGESKHKRDHAFFKTTNKRPKELIAQVNCPLST